MESKPTWESKVREHIDKEGFGVYQVLLRPEYFFDLDSNLHRIIVKYNEGSNNQITERAISGTIRRTRDYQDSILSVEVYRDFNAIIPYKSIMDFKKLCDTSFIIDSALEKELRRSASRIVNRKAK